MVESAETIIALRLRARVLFVESKPKKAGAHSIESLLLARVPTSSAYGNEVPTLRSPQVQFKHAHDSASISIRPHEPSTHALSRKKCHHELHYENHEAAANNLFPKAD